MALNVRGGALRLQGRHRSACTALRHAVALAPHDAGVHSTLADTCLAASLLEEAERHARTAIELSPKSVSARNAYGLALARRSRFDDAIEFATEQAGLGSEAVDAGMVALLGRVEAEAALAAHDASDFTKSKELAGRAVRHFDESVELGARPQPVARAIADNLLEEETATLLALLFRDLEQNPTSVESLRRTARLASRVLDRRHAQFVARYLLKLGNALSLETQDD